MVSVISFVNGHICITEHFIWETVLRAYPSWVQVWGAFWLPQLQTASLWSPFGDQLCAFPASQRRNIFICRLLFAPRDPRSRLRATPGCILHGCAEAYAALTCTRAERPAVSAHFSLTPRRKALAKRWRSPDTRPLASKVEASKVSIVSGNLSDAFFFLTLLQSWTLTYWHTSV